MFIGMKKKMRVIVLLEEQANYESMYVREGNYLTGVKGAGLRRALNRTRHKTC